VIVLPTSATALQQITIVALTEIPIEGSEQFANTVKHAVLV